MIKIKLNSKTKPKAEWQAVKLFCILLTEQRVKIETVSIVQRVAKHHRELCGDRIGVYGCSPFGRSEMFTFSERGIISKGDGVVVICRGDSRIAREMFTFSEREITQRGCA